MNETLSAYQACYEDNPLPKKITSHDLMTLKRVLETHRKRSGKLNRDIVKLEANLVERSAELNNNVAISILAGETLKDSSATQDDKDHATKLLTDLMKRNFPYAFKVSADLSYQSGNPDVALKLYHKALKYSKNSPVLESDCCRSIGLLSLSSSDLSSAAKYFKIAVELAPELSAVSDCHYYLGQLYEQDKQLAKYHFEQAASVGFAESFAPLGFLLLNYFNRPLMAIEWFKLGTMTSDENCLVGLFDSYVRLNDLEEAKKIVEKLPKIRELRGNTVSRLSETDKTVEPPRQSSSIWS